MSEITVYFLSERANEYAHCIFHNTGCMDNCVAFIDGKVLGVVRPAGKDVLQSVDYSGHKRKKHSIFKLSLLWTDYAFTCTGQKLVADMKCFFTRHQSSMKNW